MGTTNTRAWLVSDRHIVARADATVGIRDAAMAGGAQVLRTATASLLARLESSDPGSYAPESIVAAGMISSDLGLAEVPHVPAPAGVRELAAGIQRHHFTELGSLEVRLVPGVRTGPQRCGPETIATADVMRGEETLCVGLHDAGLLPSGSTLLNLGSHWKLVRVDAAGRIAGSVTSLSGELLHAAQTRTILAASVPLGRPDELHPEWARAGILEGRRSGLERTLFCVRLLEQRAESSPAERLSYLVGAFVGVAVERLLTTLPPDAPIVLAGGGVVGNAFVAALREEGREARLLEASQVEQGMVRGLSVLAAAARTLAS